jgi:hypothetical protein
LETPARECCLTLSNRRRRFIGEARCDLRTKLSLARCAFVRCHRRSVMRSMDWARWATCALAITICVPALADRSRAKSLADCTSFDQSNKGDAAVELTIHNTCAVPIDCKISWRVVCAPDSRKRRSVHPNETRLALNEGAAQSAEASATICGDDGWAIEAVEWSCQPNKD